MKPEFEEYIAGQIRAGRFASRAEAIEAGVARLMMDEEDALPEETAVFRELLAAGLEHSARGESKDWDIDEIRAEGMRLLKLKLR